MNEHTYSDNTHIWLVKDLWEAAKDLPVTSMALTEIVDIDVLLGSHTWSKGKMSVIEIVDHHTRIQNADLQYPVILTPEGHIADGVHRIVKAYLQGVRNLPTVKLQTMPKSKEVDQLVAENNAWFVQDP